MALIVVLLAAGRAVSAQVLRTVASDVESVASGMPVELHLVSWSGPDEPVDLASSIELRPRRQPKLAPPTSGGPLAWGAYAGTRLVRAGRWRARRLTAYRWLEQKARGSLVRQVAVGVTRNRDVVRLVSRADVVMTLDAGSVRAAWRLARRTSRPAVVHGRAAGLHVIASLVAAAQAADQPAPNPIGGSASPDAASPYAAEAPSAPDSPPQREAAQAPTG